MEFGNIGNYYIIEPFIRELYKVFPNSSIKTTMQMSERLCKEFGFTAGMLKGSLAEGRKIPFFKGELNHE